MGKYVFVTKYACADWLVGLILSDIAIIPQKWLHLRFSIVISLGKRFMENELAFMFN